MDILISILGHITLFILALFVAIHLLILFFKTVELLFESHKEGNFNPFFRLLGFEMVPAYYRQRAQSVAEEAKEVLEAMAQHRREGRPLHSSTYHCEELLNRYLKLLKETVFEHEKERKNEKPRGS